MVRLRFVNYQMMMDNKMISKLRKMCFACLGVVGWCNLFFLMHKPDFFIDASQKLNLPWIVIPSYILLTGTGILLCSELIITPAKPYWNALLIFVFSSIFLYAQCLTVLAPSRLACHCVSTLETLRTIKDWTFLKLALVWFFLSCVYLVLDTLWERDRVQHVNVTTKNE